MLMPMVRADFQLANEYSAAPGPLLDCAITAFAGRRDPDITVEDVAGWERHTRGRFRLLVLEAGHHFVREPAGEVMRELVRVLEERGEDR
jgi:surfactin synthase thioesterase subunit